MSDAAWLNRGLLSAYSVVGSPRADVRTGGAGRADDAELAADCDLLDHCTGQDTRLLDEPHIVVCTDLLTGVTTYTGPFRSGAEALAQLAEIEDGQQPAAGLRTVVCSLAPLLPG